MSAARRVPLSSSSRVPPRQGRRPRPSRGPRPRRLRIEFLEDRRMLADTVAHWIGGSGNWSDPTKWDIGLVPNNAGATTYAVVIDRPGSDPAITLDQRVTINSLTNAEAVTVANSKSLTVKGGMELNGMLTLASMGSTTNLYFDGSQTVSGTGQLVFGGTSSSQGIYSRGNNGNSPATLTIGRGITIHGSQSGTVGGYYSNDSLVNQGTIHADTAGKTITVTGANWSNTGLRKASGGDSLNLGGSVTMANIGSVNAAGGTVNVMGVLNNSSTRLALDATAGNLGCPHIAFSQFVVRSRPIE